ncbi:MAG: hypothetical protein DMG61_00835 [Acidobacteria bacterium]|nr:MAG: hypothetical protein DMG61_00835 [Acidobacteriota bacterium]
MSELFLKSCNFFRDRGSEGLPVAKRDEALSRVAAWNNYALIPLFTSEHRPSPTRIVAAC